MEGKERYKVDFPEVYGGDYKVLARMDYDSWEAAGNPGWGYRHALHYFKKSEV